MSRWRYPFSFSITQLGALYILLVFVLALGAVNTGNNMLYLILSLLLSATLISGIVARLSLRSMFVSLQVPQNVFEKEEFSVKISLKNQKRRFTSFSILVEDLALVQSRKLSYRLRRLMRRESRPAADETPAPVLRHAAYFPAVPPGETRSELITQSFERRGRYQLDGLRLSTRFPFGFFQRGERVAVSGEVLVYPTIREISSDFHLLPFMPGKLEGMRTGPGESLYAIRNYHDGESARLIHWKATAKTGKLMAREYARDEESEFCLILDTGLPSSPAADASVQFEKAVSLTASLAAHFAHEAAEFEYLTPGEFVPRGTGTEHLYRILRSLAVVTSRPAGNSEVSPAASSMRDLIGEYAGGADFSQLERIFSGKVFKIMISSRRRDSLPASVWRSSHVIYFDEL